MRLFVLATLSAALGVAQDPSTDAAFFESRVRPVLAAKCYSCHGADRQFSDLRLDSVDAARKGGQRGPGAEWIGKAVRQEGGLKMPPAGKLPPAEIAALEQWVSRGMPWPNATAVKDRKAPHWAFQPLSNPAPQSIDRFLQAKRSEKGLRQSPPADKRTLARRAAFIVTGLPPAPDLLTRFLDTNTPAAWPAYVDALLASPRYGERWARHWMDLVRFAETYGYEWNFEIQGAWRYRDYLIRSFNSDLPFSQFIREHVAGDLLPQPRFVDGKNESALATAFYRLGEMGHDNCNQFREIRTDVVDNQIDTLTKAFQGVTVSCARCHDHKFDPIPTEDYYALYGILNSSRPVARTLNTAAKPKIEPLKDAIRSELTALWLREATDISSHWTALLERKEIDQTDPVYPILHPEKQYPATDPAPSLSFTGGLPPGWSARGLGLQQVQTGNFAIAPEGDRAIEIIFPAGLATNVFTDKWDGTLRSPILPRDQKFLSLEMAGSRSAAQRVVMDHCVIGEDHKLIDNPLLHLEKVPTRNDQPLKTYLELNTVAVNPRLPERPGKFKLNPPENSPRSWFVVTRGFFHNEDEPPQPSFSHLRGYFEKQPNQARIEEFLSAAVRRWRDGQSSDDDVRWLNWALANELLSNKSGATETLTRLVGDYRTAEQKWELPAVAAGMADVDPGADYPILLSGQALNPGRPAPRHFLSLMPESLRKVDARGSGRREMAEAIASPDNPLTARVYVNRVWHHVFGRGIVPTTDNFGRLSDPPSHPELLDSLARSFIDEGWSTKRLLRRLLLTEAFQQSSAADPPAREKDPQNAFLHHYPVRRLEAEAVRDSILAISGRLDETMFGPSIQPHRTEPADHRRLFQGPLDGNGRRSIYTKVTRMQGPPFLEAFDFPAPLQTRGNRDVTNVPSQALAMLNDPFVMDQAKVWATRLVARQDDAIDARLAAMFNTALGRPPSAQELAVYRTLIGNLGDPSLTSLELWQTVAHTLLNSKEFLYIP